MRLKRKIYSHIISSNRHTEEKRPDVETDRGLKKKLPIHSKTDRSRPRGTSQ